MATAFLIDVGPIAPLASSTERPLIEP
jgi:hypothetical protein